MSMQRKYAVALTATLGVIMAVLDNTIVNVALIPMAQALGASLSAIQWVVTGYFLAQAAVIPIAGYLGIRLGIRRLFMICLALFTLGSVLCGLAQNEASLIIFRLLQGIGAGALFPLSQAITFGAFSPQERASASAIVSVPVLLAPAFGPTLGGWLTVSFGWESIFFINLPIGLLALLLAWRVLPPDPARPAQPVGGFDYIGLTLSTLGVLAVVFAFALVSEPQPGTQTPLNPQGILYGWGAWQVWSVLLAGVVLLVGFALYELHVSKDPVLDLRMYRRADFTLPSMVIWCNAMVVFGSLFLLPVFLQQIHTPPFSALDAGLILMPQGLATTAAVGLGGRLYHRVGVRAMVLTGAVLLITSSWAMSWLTPSTSSTELLPWLIVRGFGFGLTFFPAQTRALETISGPALAKASSLFNVTRQIASSIGLAAIVTLFVQRGDLHVRELVDQAGGATALSPEQLAQFGALGGTQAMNDVFLVVTFGSCLLLLLALALPGRQQPAHGTTEGELGAQPMLMD